MEELLTKFSGLLDNYARHREYINRAQAQTSKFSSEIIEKVVLDHEIKSSSLADEILPFIPEIEGFISKIDTEKQDILSNKSSSDEAMQEIELRHLIGEIDDDEFNALTGDLRGTLDVANGRLESLDTEHGTLSEALERWVGLAKDAKQDAGLSDAEEAEEAEEAVEEEPADEELIIEADDDAEFEELEEPVLEEDDFEEQEVMIDEPDTSAEEALGDISFDPIATEPDGTHSSFGRTEDLSVILGEDDHDNGDDGPIIATMEVDDEADEFPFDDDDDEPAEVILDPMDEDEDDDGSHSIDDVAGIVVDFENVEVEPELHPVSGEPRRALLLYQEGTAEEQIYPFTGDVLTIGRGRDNDIQIKNDSKVSRFHCKLFRRSANFYIEDNKSSNGTLVNGELITERRLFGGEEVIIGETFFRFRIM
ncbi:MAG: hypothetical protein ACI8RZ_002717 [Myxococcota bacterium]|jgi:hypothetical protein